MRSKARETADRNEPKTARKSARNPPGGPLSRGGGEAAPLHAPPNENRTRERGKKKREKKRERAPRKDEAKGEGRRRPCLLDDEYHLTPFKVAGRPLAASYRRSCNRVESRLPSENASLDWPITIKTTARQTVG